MVHILYKLCAHADASRNGWAFGTALRCQALDLRIIEFLRMLDSCCCDVVILCCRCAGCTDRPAGRDVRIVSRTDEINLRLCVMLCGDRITDTAQDALDVPMTIGQLLERRISEDFVVNDNQLSALARYREIDGTACHILQIVSVFDNFETNRILNVPKLCEVIDEPARRRPFAQAVR